MRMEDCRSCVRARASLMHCRREERRLCGPVAGQSRDDCIDALAQLGSSAPPGDDIRDANDPPSRKCRNASEFV